MNRTARPAAITLTSILLFGPLAWGQVKPIPKPVTPPSPNPTGSPPAGRDTDRPSVPPVGNVPSAAAPESAVAPFVDAQTIGAMELDVRGLDLKAIREWVIQGVQELRKSEKEIGRAQGDVGDEFDKFAHGVENLRTVGVARIYWVLSLEDMTADHPPFAVIPLAEGQDPGRVQAVFKSLWGNTKLSTAVMGRTVVFGAQATLDRLKAAAPAPRIELARAFNAAGNGQIRIALIPQESPRKALESISGDLPKELGGGSIQTVSRGLSWTSVSIAFPPQPAFRIWIQSPDPQSAAKLNDVIVHAIDWARDRKEGPPEALAFTRMIGQLKPKLEGDRITIDLPPEDLQRMSATIASAMLTARTQAKRTESKSNLRQLELGVTMYATQHKGQLPKTLNGNDLAPYLGGPDGLKRLWADPLRPNQSKPYVYLKLADKISDIKDPPLSVMIYENHSTWDDGINVAFADGHVEWVAEEKQFKGMLDQTKKNNPGAVEMPQ